jgi:hypothetical protein
VADRDTPFVARDWRREGSGEMLIAASLPLEGSLTRERDATDVDRI